MVPYYFPDIISSLAFKGGAAFIPWIDVSPNRRECFMTEAAGVSYTYGQGPWARTYVSVEMNPEVSRIMWRVNAFLNYPGVMGEWRWSFVSINGCFLNHYKDETKALGWHADDFDLMDHTHPVAVVSFGEPREIWWKRQGEKGRVPPSQRQLLGDGSLFIMPPGFQQEFFHKIPKGGKAMSPRTSLTFRRFKGLG